MFYLKINEKIRELLNLYKDLRVGCRDYCTHQLIALDELELLKIELETQKIKILSPEEFNDIKNSAKNVYFHSTHVCVHDNNFQKDKIAQVLDDNQSEIDTSISDSLKQRKRPDVNSKFRVAYDFNDKKGNDIEFEESVKSKDMNENTMSYGVSMIGGFFLIVMGSYFLGKDYLGWSQANTLKLTLVVTIVVFFAESFLLIIKLSKSDGNSNGKFSGKLNEKIKKYSLAYKLNTNYRNSFSQGYQKNKVNHKNDDNKTKTD